MHFHSIPTEIGGRHPWPRFSNWQPGSQLESAQAQVARRPGSDERLACLLAPLLALAISLVTFALVSELVVACGSLRLDDLARAVAGA